MSETDNDKQKSVTVIDCGESLDIRVIEEFKTGLINAFDAGKPVSLLGQGIERIDTSGLQLLCAFINDAKSRSLAVSWDSPSQALQEAAQLSGLTRSLDL